MTHDVIGLWKLKSSKSNIFYLGMRSLKMYYRSIIKKYNLMVLSQILH